MMTSLDEITKKSHKNDGLDHQSEVERACKRLSQKDFSFFPAAKTKSLLQSVKADALDDFEQFQSSWARLSLDQYMADGGNYRKRRHATLSALPSSCNFHIQAHQPHSKVSTTTILMEVLRGTMSLSRVKLCKGQLWARLLLWAASYLVVYRPIHLGILKRTNSGLKVKTTA